MNRESDGPKTPQVDLWARLRSTTPARIGLARIGNALPLDEVLAFQQAHARARDAVHTPLDAAALEEALAPMRVIQVESAAPDRATYLRRPDLGRVLSERSRGVLAERREGCDVLFVVGDGLSATGIQAGGADLVRACVQELSDLTIGPVVVARQARVALGDPIGEALGARVCVTIIGERPGLTVSDSLGIYMTFGPRSGRADSERNCISNVHKAGGLSARDAARTLGWLLRAALRLGLSGVDLKDTSSDSLLSFDQTDLKKIGG